MIWTLNEPSRLDTVWQLIGEKYSLEQSRPGTTVFQVMDDFEHHILRSGAALTRHDEHYRLATSKRNIDLERAEPFLFANELEAGEFQQQLGKLIGVRKLQLVASEQLQTSKVTIRDKETKMVLRLDVMKGRDCCFIKLQPIRGYEKVAHRVRFLLAEQGAKLDELPIARVLLNASNFSLSTYTAKPEFALDPMMPSREAVRSMVSSMLSIARENEAGVINDGDDTEYLHDYRICLRKARSLISLLKEVYPAEIQQNLKQRLGDVARRTNELRDLDVYLLEQGNYARLIPESLGNGIPLMFEDFRKTHEKAYASVCRWFNSKSYDQEMRSLQAFFSAVDEAPATSASEQPIKSLVTRKILKRYRNICKLGLAITPQTQDAEVHELRIEAKKFRYLLEFFATLYKTRKIKQLVSRLKVLQDNLGRFNDFSVQQDSLNAYLQSHQNNAEMAKSIGALLMVLAQKQIEERSHVEERFAGFADQVTEELVHELFD
jgi:CHAD domain-containing protein